MDIDKNYVFNMIDNKNIRITITVSDQSFEVLEQFKNYILKQDDQIYSCEFEYYTMLEIDYLISGIICHKEIDLLIDRLQYDINKFMDIINCKA